MEVVAPSLAGAVVIKPAGKDSRWLTLEVCREFARANCPRTAEECKYAHPPSHVEIQNGRVTCCYDSIKGKCQRNTPPCKYLHPPSHLQEQLLQTGKQNLAMKNLQAAQAVAVAGLQPVVQMGGSNPSSMYSLLYNDSLKLPSGYPTMVFPQQYPYMPMNQQLLAGNMAGATSAVSPYQIYASLNQPASLPQQASPYMQVFDPVTGTVSQQLAPPGFNAVSLPMQAANGAHLFNMPGTSQLDMWNAMNNAQNYRNTLSQNGLLDDQTALTTTAAPSSAKVVYKEVAMAASQQVASSSPVVYQQSPPALAAAAAGADQIQTTSGRKRTHAASEDMLMGMHAVGASGMLPSGIKRPALVDNKTGLPFYQPLPTAGNPYQQMMQYQTPQPRFVTLGSVAGCSSMMPPY